MACETSVSGKRAERDRQKERLRYSSFREREATLPRKQRITSATSHLIIRLDADSGYWVVRRLICIGYAS